MPEVLKHDLVYKELIFCRVAPDVNESLFFAHHSKSPKIAIQGLAHRLTQFSMLLTEAALMRRVAVLPPLVLSHKHGKDLNLTKRYRWQHYVDLEAFGCSVADAAARARLAAASQVGRRVVSVTRSLKGGIVDTESTRSLAADRATGFLLRDFGRAGEMHWVMIEAPSFYPPSTPPQYLNEWLAMYRHMRCRFRFSAPIMRQAARIKRLLHGLSMAGGPLAGKQSGNATSGAYLAAHIRRGDRLTGFGATGLCTDPEAVRRVLVRLLGGRTMPMFIMTDETSDLFTTLLRSERGCPTCPVLLATDAHTMLVRLTNSTVERIATDASGAPPDDDGVSPELADENYFRFAVEAEVLAGAQVRVSTYKDDLEPGGPSLCPQKKTKGFSAAHLYVTFPRLVDRSGCADSQARGVDRETPPRPPLGTGAAITATSKKEVVEARLRDLEVQRQALEAQTKQAQQQLAELQAEGI